MFSFVKTVKQPICKAFIEFTSRHIHLKFSVYLLTRSGVTYTSGMKINLIVDKVTAFPDIQYYSPTEANKPLQNDTIIQDN